MHSKLFRGSIFDITVFCLKDTGPTIKDESSSWCVIE